jgi:hypothetical protein
MPPSIQIAAQGMCTALRHLLLLRTSFLGSPLFHAPLLPRAASQHGSACTVLRAFLDSITQLHGAHPLRTTNRWWCEGTVERQTASRC